MYSTATLFLVLAALAQSANAAPVHQLAQGGQCLSVPNPSNGATVTLAACDSANSNQETTTNQQWVIQPGNNQGVQLFGTDLCLDAQTDPAPGRPTVVYPCIGSGPQTWYLTPDDRIAITGGTQCLSVAGSNAETQNCAPGLNSQAFTPTLLFNTDAASSSAASASTSASATNGGIIGGGVGSVTSGAASATSQVASSASSAAGQLSSSLASVSSSISSAVAGASQSASSAASAATASASSAIAGASNSASSAVSGASSMASMATASASSMVGSVTSGTSSMVGSATSGASSVAAGASSGASSALSQATGTVGSATQAAGSAASAATSAAGAGTSAATSGAGSSLPNFGLPAVVSIFGIAIGAIML